MKTHEEAILHFFSKMDLEMLETFLDMATYQDLPKDTFIRKLAIAFGKFHNAGDVELVRHTGVCKGSCENKGSKGYAFIGNQSDMQMNIVILVKDDRVVDLFDCFGLSSSKTPKGCKKVFINSLFD